MEIKYCSKCRSRVSSVDVASRKGIETPEGKLFCDSCAQELDLYNQFPAEEKNSQEAHSLTGQFRALQAKDLEKSGPGSHRRVRKAPTGKHKTGTGKHKTGSGKQRRVRRTRRISADEAPVTETGRIRRKKLQQQAQPEPAPVETFEPEEISPEDFFKHRKEETSEKSKSPLLLILSIIAAGLLGAVIAVFMGRGEQKSEDGNQNTEIAEPVTEQPEKVEVEKPKDPVQEKPETAEKPIDKPEEVEKPEEKPLIQDKIADIPATPAKKYLEADGWSSMLGGDWEDNLTSLRAEWSYSDNLLTATTSKGEVSPAIETSGDWGDHKAGFTFAASGNVNLEFKFAGEGSTCLIRVPEPGVWHNLTWEIKENDLISVELDGKNILTEQTAQFKVYTKSIAEKGKISVGITPYDQKNTLKVSFSELAFMKPGEETAGETGEEGTPEAAADLAGVWIEGEKPSTSKILKHSWYDNVQRELLSGKDWVSHYADDKTTVGELLYKFKVKGGAYTFWLRAITSVTKPFYQIDGGGWKEIDLTKKKETLNISPNDKDGNPKTDHRWIAWMDLGKVDLKEGEHTVEFKFDGGLQMSGGIDCFTFTTDADYSPKTIEKPKDAGGDTEVIAVTKEVEVKPISDKPLGDEIKGMIFGDDFEKWSGNKGNWTEAYNSKGTAAPSTAAARSGKRSLKAVVTADKAGAYLKAAIKPVSSCYVRMMLYLEPGWDSTFVNKDDNAFLMRVTGAAGKGVYFYIRKSDIQQICFQAHADGWPGSYSNGLATPGQWMSIEVYCPPAGTDMAFKTWVNGKEKSFTASMPDNGPWENVAVGFSNVKAGARPVAYIDDVIVSKEYIGPDKSVGEVLTAKTNWSDVYSQDFEGEKVAGALYLPEKKYKLDKRSAKAAKGKRKDPYYVKGIIPISPAAPIDNNSRILVSYYTNSERVEIILKGKDGDGNEFEALIKPSPTAKAKWENLELLMFDLEVTKGKLSGTVSIDAVEFLAGDKENEKKAALYIDNLKIQK